MMQFISHLRNLMRFMLMPKSQRKLTFYSESKNYWAHLEGLVNELLATSDISVCYISSDDEDPGLKLDHPNYHSFKIDDGYIRNWLFENIETDVMVMTMPDLGQYQVKRSKYDVHYVYVQHSLVSLHMAYRKGAFDHYDTIFCAGPHHIKEIRAMEAKYNLPEKNLVEHGYFRLDSIIKETKRRPFRHRAVNEPQHVLIAPSWGSEGTIESGFCINIIDKLIGNGCKVTLRPHPQTIKFSQNRIDEILKKHSENILFNYESNVAGQESLHTSDIMISDWSGAALDYAFGLNKPVIFINVPRKINNEDYQSFGIEPFEVTIRESIGGVMEISELNNIDSFLELPGFGSIEHPVFNCSKSSKKGCLMLREICNAS
ncbi:MAG: putative CDP-glycerol:Poly(glycerophosphate) glycerophosphotransferase [Osedax symbiont Rs2]|nr:MAG: putative CDP-glycerol:Poly(glycerophosphate) glycerophosphotransferase [Osedax symbiont Rs2]